MILNFPASKCSEFVCFFLTNFRLVVFIKFVLIKKSVIVCTLNMESLSLQLATLI